MTAETATATPIDVTTEATGGETAPANATRDEETTGAATIETTDTPTDATTTKTTDVPTAAPIPTEPHEKIATANPPPQLPPPSPPRAKP
jgi:hypothetical protein